MKYIVYGSKNQKMIVNKVTLERCLKRNERHFDLLLHVLMKQVDMLLIPFQTRSKVTLFTIMCVNMFHCQENCVSSACKYVWLFAKHSVENVAQQNENIRLPIIYIVHLDVCFVTEATVWINLCEEGRD